MPYRRRHMRREAAHLLCALFVAARALAAAVALLALAAGLEYQLLEAVAATEAARR